MRGQLLAVTTLLTVMLVSAASMAQDGSSVIINRDDNGGQKVLHFSMPNLEELRTPDFTRRDLPIFTDKLVLSEPQTAAVGRFIDAYIEAFIALTKDLALTAGDDAQYAPETQDQPARARGRGKAAVAFGGGGPGLDLSDLEGQLPPGTNVSIGVSMMAPRPGGDGGADAADGQGAGAEIGGKGGGEAVPPGAKAAMNLNPTVQVSVDSPEGEDIPQGVLDQIKERADKMAAEIMQRVMAKMNGADQPEGGPDKEKPGPLLVGKIEDMQARQEELQKKVEQFKKDKARLRGQFVTDAQQNLAEQQIQRWPVLERALTRERSLPRGRLAGESTDLVEVLASQKLEDWEMLSVAAQVEEYEMSLDAALKQRDAFLADASRNIDAAIAENKPEKAVSIADRSADLRVAVRNINQQSMEQIAQTLGAERGAAFRFATLKAFYPQVYHQTRAQKMFETLAKMDSVDASKVSDIADLRVAYEAELTSLNEQIRQTMDREGPKQSQRGLQQLKRTMKGQDAGGPPDVGFIQQEDPIRAAMEKRADLDDRYLKLVASMVTPEQAQALPHPRTHKSPIIIRGGP